MKTSGAAEREAAVRAAEQAWPRIRLPAGSLARRLGELPGSDPRHASDLFLALACARGDAEALRVLDAQLSAEVPRALAKLRQPAAFAQDVRQVLLEKLVVDSPARILTYSGRGALAPWLRSAALRAALDMLKAKRPEGTLPEHAPAPAAEPELAHLKRRFAGPLKQAVEAALQALPLDERNALRFYFLEGMTVEQIASLRGIHKSNVSRLITRTRKAVLEEVRRRLTEEHRLAPEELDSVLRLVQSQVALSLERALAAPK